MEEQNTTENVVETGEKPEKPDFRGHFAELERQAAALQQAFPEFSLQRELQNPLFVRLTSPYAGLGVEDAFFAVHRRELQAASMQVAAQDAERKLANAVASGSRRPEENGMTGKGASVTVFDYRHATAEQKAALKRRIRQAAARGEKIYPGR